MIMALECIEPVHEISNNVVCATSKVLDMIVKLLSEHLFLVSKLKRMLQRLVRVYTCQMPHCWKSRLELECHGSYLRLL